MEPYNFWQDFFDTYQSLSDWIKALWLIVPPAFVMGLTAVVMQLRIDSKQADCGFTGKLIYSIQRDEEGQFHVVAHDRKIGGTPTILLLDRPDRDPHAPQNPTRRT